MDYQTAEFGQKDFLGLHYEKSITCVGKIKTSLVKKRMTSQRNLQFKFFNVVITLLYIV